MQNKIIESYGLKTIVNHGNYGEYRFKSPRYGYKKAYHYNYIIQVYKDTQMIVKVYLKDLKLKELNGYIKAISDFINDTDFSNMVQRYKQAKELAIDYSFVRKLKDSIGK